MSCRIVVLVPVYNAGPYLVQCLDSLLAQKPPIDVLCCDDGSTDGSDRVLDEYARRSPRVRVIHREHRGMVPTYNELLDGMAGDYDAFAFCDADDYVHPEAYATLAAAMEETGADVAECGVRIVPADSVAPAGTGDVPNDQPARLVYDDMRPFWLSRTVPPPGYRQARRKWNKLYRRAAVGDLRLRPGLDYEDDVLYSAEVHARIRRKVCVSRVLYAYRDNPQAMNGRIDPVRYARSVALRLRLSCETFLVTGRVPADVRPQWRAELAKDAYRMLVRKNLKKTSDPSLRRALFAEAGRTLDALRRDFGIGTETLNPIQRMLCAACRGNRYGLARLLVFLT